jgi:hypothetical protein
MTTVEHQKTKKFVIPSRDGDYVAELKVHARRPFAETDGGPTIRKSFGFTRSTPKYMYLVEIDDEHTPGQKERIWLSSHHRWKH